MKICKGYCSDNDKKENYRYIEAMVLNREQLTVRRRHILSYETIGGDNESDNNIDNEEDKKEDTEQEFFCNSKWQII